MERVFCNGRLLAVWVCADFDYLPRPILRYLALYNPYEAHEVQA